MSDFLSNIVGWIDSTEVLQQISLVDAGGLFTNGYFLVPFISLIAYLLYKQAFTNLVLLAIGIGVWYISGTQYMKELIVDGEMQLEKILPVALGAVVVVGVIIYLIFGRTD